jgi:hypothetical protein
VPAFELRLLYQRLIFLFIAEMKALGHYVAQVLALLNAMTKGWPCEGLLQPDLSLTLFFAIFNSFR